MVLNYIQATDHSGSPADWRRSLSVGNAAVDKRNTTEDSSNTVKFSFPMIGIETLATDVSSVATFTFTVSVFLVNLLDRDNIPRETIPRETIRQSTI
jgi:hypothetical protein